mmetsp:Transcript_28271/g.64206  ORF Transcript_28271/g.64206 Transcript_28271/m.64206 type:complete len:251 (-) Transcript_28271:610-1362(-)
MTGSPRMAASAMVPGPALVMRTSQAAIHSSIFLTYPFTITFTEVGKFMDPSSSWSAALEPQTTIACLGAPARPNSLMVARATFFSPPTPSPPPTISTLGTPRCMASLPCTFFWSSPEFQKAGRMGKPSSRSLGTGTPSRKAMRRMGALGMYTRSASGENQVGCAPPKSVHTVTKGTARLPPPMAFSTRRGRFWQSGCTEMMRSGAFSSKTARNFLKEVALPSSWKIHLVIGKSAFTYMSSQTQGFLAANW